MRAKLILILMLMLAGLGAWAQSPQDYVVMRAWEHVRRADVTPPLWTPADLPGNVIAWFDAAEASTLWADTDATTQSANGDSVARWDDKSENEYNITSAAPPQKTTEGVYFNGSTYLASLFFVGDLKTSRAGSFFVVAKDLTTGGGLLSFQRNLGRDYTSGISMDSAAGFRSFVGNGNLAYGAANFLKHQYNANPINTYALRELLVSAAASSRGVYLDGASMPNDAPQGSMLLSDFLSQRTWEDHRIIVGASSTDQNNTIDRLHQTTVAEVLCLSEFLSTDDRQRVEGYLAHKWGLTANLPSDPLHPYKNAPPYK